MFLIFNYTRSFQGNIQNKHYTFLYCSDSHIFMSGENIWLWVVISGFSSYWFWIRGWAQESNFFKSIPGDIDSSCWQENIPGPPLCFLYSCLYMYIYIHIILPFPSSQSNIVNIMAELEIILRRCWLDRRNAWVREWMNGWMNQGWINEQICLSKEHLWLFFCHFTYLGIVQPQL